MLTLMLSQSPVENFATTRRNILQPHDKTKLYLNGDLKNIDTPC